MPENHVLLESVYLDKSVATITFDNIPQTGYTDLRLVMSIRKSDSNTLSSTYLTFNGSTSGYASRRLYGNGTGVASDSNPTGTATAYIGSTNSSTSRANTFSSVEVYIPNYTSTSAKPFYSEMVQEDNITAGYQFILANSWSGTQAISSLSITGDGNFVQYSTFHLYGIAKSTVTPVTGPFAEGGNIVANDGTYWYHAFTSSGTFTPLKALTCDYVVVAGGGGGGGGGSGAGGFKTSIGGSALSVTKDTNYAIAVGAGGSGSMNVSYGTPVIGPTQGSSSVFSSITATGGGRGGTASGLEGATGTSTAYLSGGSGGGACYNSGTSNYGLGTAGEGNNGGQDLHNGSPYSSAGGGGAGAVGQNTQSDSVCGAGGIGTYNAITNAIQFGQLSGGNYYLAGGGGGGMYGLAGSGTAGAGGIGGGGTGSNGASGTTRGTSGSPNTGGGAGGSSASSFGANGGSGVVIIRYSMV